MKRSKTYYNVRSVVRWVFWSTTVFLFMLGFGAVVDHFDESDENRCEVAVNFDFTWTSTTGDRVDVEQCSHPQGVDLLQDGTWIWTPAD